MAKKIDKQALRMKIQELDIDNELKSQLLDAVSEKKTFGLVWEEKEEEAQERLRVELPVFVEDESKRIVNSDDAPNHVIIEGDNLHALTALTYTHKGKIDIIYIDPPYNRGENDFCYDDKFIVKDDPFKHSLWLSFMKRRLLIAKKLLSDRGILITHIDEHEFDALHLLLENDIFNGECNLGMIIWNKLNPKGDAHNVAVMHEYILVFCKNKEVFVNSENALMRDKPNAEQIINKGANLWKKVGKCEVPTDVKSILSSYKYSKSKIQEFAVEYTEETVLNEFQSWLKKSDFSKGEKAYKYLDKNGEVFRTVSMAWPNKEVAPSDYWIPLRHPITGEECPVPSKGWRNPSSRMSILLGTDAPIIYNEDFVVKGEIAFTRKRNGELNIPERVYYLKDNMMENVSSIYNDGSSDEQLLADLKINFPYPKCISVAKYLIKNILKDKKAIVLDFFAGSGTTLHATMELNAEDGGNRKCILVSNNQNNICEEVTYVRNKAIINGYTTKKGSNIFGLTNNNLRYYRTDFVSRQSSHQNKKAQAYAMLDLLCIKENVYDEQKMFGSLSLEGKEKLVRYFADDETKMLLIYDTRVVPYIVREIAGMAEENLNIKTYIFADGSYPYTADFEEVLSKVTLVAMPFSMNKALSNVLPVENDIELNDEPDTEEE